MPKKKAKKKVKKRIRKKVVVKAKKETKKKEEILKIPDEKAFELLKRSRIPVVPYIFCSKEVNLEKCLKKIGFPCVMKVSGRNIIHKSDIEGVILNIENEEEALDAFKKLKKKKGCEKVLVQKQIKGLELIVGGIFDRDFGECISFGGGGIFTEVLKDVSFRVCPIEKRDAEELIKETKIYEILKGYRGKKYNIDSISDLLQKVSRLLLREKIKEMDINPLFCDKKTCLVADVRIIKR